MTCQSLRGLQLPFSSCGTARLILGTADIGQACCGDNAGDYLQFLVSVPCLADDIPSSRVQDICVQFDTSETGLVLACSSEQILRNGPTRIDQRHSDQHR